MALHQTSTNKRNGNAMKAFRKTAGFTLVETLVVVTIVIVLAGILYGVFVRRKEAGYRAHCQSHLSQIFLALQSYAQDNDSRFPSLLSWHKSITPYVKNKDIFLCPSVGRHWDESLDLDYGAFASRFGHVGRADFPGASEAELSNTANWILMTDFGDEESKEPNAASGGASTTTTRPTSRPRIQVG